jgi:hypothetical protein
MSSNFFRIMFYYTSIFIFNLFPFFSLFFFKSYYLMSLNEVINHSISNRLLKKSFKIHFTNIRKCYN